MTKMTKISAAIITSLVFAGMANATTPGAYVGVGAGASTLRTPNSYMFNIDNAFNAGSTSRQRSGLGGRLFAGYNFNQYFGLEASYATYASSTYKASLDGDSASLKYSLNAINLVAKGYLPLGNSGFNAYALAGLADVRNQVRYNNANDIPLANGVTANFKNGTTNYYRIRPVYGVGVGYDLAQHITTNVELSRIQGAGNVKTSASAIPNADMLTLNFGYNFG